jgi:hypothetical protein
MAVNIQWQSNAQVQCLSPEVGSTLVEPICQMCAVGYLILGSFFLMSCDSLWLQCSLGGWYISSISRYLVLKVLPNQRGKEELVVFCVFTFL